MKAVSSLLMLSFLFQEISYANPDLLEADGGKRIVERGERQRKENLRWAKSLLPDLPESIATIEDAWKPSSTLHSPQSTILLIQDAHTNNSGQINVAKILDILFQEGSRIADHGSRKYVFLEAGSGNESLSFLRKYASLHRREQVAKSFLMQGKLQGTEYLDLTSNHDFILWGVEDLSLYAKSVSLYREVVKQREKFQDYLNRIDSTIKTLKPKIYNPFLLAFDQKYKTEQISLTDYFDILIQEAEKQNLSLQSYPHLKALNRLKDIEQGIDFKKANEEQQKAIASLSEEDQKELIELSKAPSKLSSEDRKTREAFFALLEEKLTSSVIARSPQGDEAISAQRSPRALCALAMTNYPELSKYFKYLKESKALKATKVLEEQKNLEEELFKSLILTKDEEKLLKASKDLEYLKKLLKLTLTPDEFEDYQHTKQPITSLTGFLNQKIMELNDHYDKAVFLEPGYEGIVKTCEEFYELTYKRDKRLIENMLEKMDHGSRIADREMMDEKGETNGTSEFREIESVSAGARFYGDGIQDYQTVSKRRALWSDEPTSESRNIRATQYSQGTGESGPGREQTIPPDSQGFFTRSFGYIRDFIQRRPSFRKTETTDSPGSIFSSASDPESYRLSENLSNRSLPAIRHPRSAILITGGYHTPNLKYLLKQKNISYISITPQVLQETNQKRYEEILLKQQIDLKPPLPFKPLVPTSMPERELMLYRQGDPSSSFPALATRLAETPEQSEAILTEAKANYTITGARLAVPSRVYLLRYSVIQGELAKAVRLLDSPTSRKVKDVIVSYPEGRTTLRSLLKEGIEGHSREVARVFAEKKAEIPYEEVLNLTGWIQIASYELDIHLKTGGKSLKRAFDRILRILDEIESSVPSDKLLTDELMPLVTHPPQSLFAYLGAIRRLGYLKKIPVTVKKSVVSLLVNTVIDNKNSALLRLVAWDALLHLKPLVHWIDKIEQLYLLSILQPKSSKNKDPRDVYFAQRLREELPILVPLGARLALQSIPSWFQQELDRHKQEMEGRKLNFVLAAQILGVDWRTVARYYKLNRRLMEAYGIRRGKSGRTPPAQNVLDKKKQIGEEIRSNRQRAGLTQEEVGIIVGRPGQPISRQAISQMEITPYRYSIKLLTQVEQITRRLAGKTPQINSSYADRTTQKFAEEVLRLPKKESVFIVDLGAGVLGDSLKGFMRKSGLQDKVYGVAIDPVFGYTEYTLKDRRIKQGKSDDWSMEDGFDIPRKRLDQYGLHSKADVVIIQSPVIIDRETERDFIQKYASAAKYIVKANGHVLLQMNSKDFEYPPNVVRMLVAFVKEFRLVEIYKPPRDYPEGIETKRSDVIFYFQPTTPGQKSANAARMATHEISSSAKFSRLESRNVLHLESGEAAELLSGLIQSYRRPMSRIETSTDREGFSISGFEFNFVVYLYPKLRQLSFYQNDRHSGATQSGPRVISKEKESKAYEAILRLFDSKRGIQTAVTTQEEFQNEFRDLNVRIWVSKKVNTQSVDNQNAEIRIEYFGSATPTSVVFKLPRPLSESAATTVERIQKALRDDKHAFQRVIRGEGEALIKRIVVRALTFRIQPDGLNFNEEALGRLAKDAKIPRERLTHNLFYAIPDEHWQILDHYYGVTVPKSASLNEMTATLASKGYSYPDKRWISYRRYLTVKELDETKTGKETFAEKIGVSPDQITDEFLGNLPKDQEILIRFYYGIGVHRVHQKKLLKTIGAALKKAMPGYEYEPLTGNQMYSLHQKALQSSVEQIKAAKEKKQSNLPVRLRREGQHLNDGWDALAYDLGVARTQLTEDRFKILTVPQRLAVESFYRLKGKEQSLEEIADALFKHGMHDAKRKVPFTQTKLLKFIAAAKDHLKNYTDGWAWLAADLKMTSDEVRARFKNLAPLEEAVLRRSYGLDLQRALNDQVIAEDLKSKGIKGRFGAVSVMTIPKFRMDAKRRLEGKLFPSPSSRAVAKESAARLATRITQIPHNNSVLYWSEQRDLKEAVYHLAQAIHTLDARDILVIPGSGYWAGEFLKRMWEVLYPDDVLRLRPIESTAAFREHLEALNSGTESVILLDDTIRSGSEMIRAIKGDKKVWGDLNPRISPDRIIPAALIVSKSVFETKEKGILPWASRMIHGIATNDKLIPYWHNIRVFYARALRLVMPQDEVTRISAIVDRGKEAVEREYLSKKLPRDLDLMVAEKVVEEFSQNPTDALAGSLRLISRRSRDPYVKEIVKKALSAAARLANARGARVANSQRSMVNWNSLRHSPFAIHQRPQAALGARLAQDRERASNRLAQVLESLNSQAYDPVLQDAAVDVKLSREVIDSLHTARTSIRKALTILKSTKLLDKKNLSDKLSDAANALQTVIDTHVKTVRMLPVEFDRRRERMVRQNSTAAKDLRALQEIQSTLGLSAARLADLNQARKRVLLTIGHLDAAENLFFVKDKEDTKPTTNAAADVLRRMVLRPSAQSAPLRVPAALENVRVGENDLLRSVSAVLSEVRTLEQWISELGNKPMDEATKEQFLMIGQKIRLLPKMAGQVTGSISNISGIMDDLEKAASHFHDALVEAGLSTDEGEKGSGARLADAKLEKWAKRFLEILDLPAQQHHTAVKSFIESMMAEFKPKERIVSLLRDTTTKFIYEGVGEKKPYRWIKNNDLRPKHALSALAHYLMYKSLNASGKEHYEPEDLALMRRLIRAYNRKRYPGLAFDIPSLFVRALAPAFRDVQSFILFSRQLQYLPRKEAIEAVSLNMVLMSIHLATVFSANGDDGPADFIIKIHHFVFMFNQLEKKDLSKEERQTLNIGVIASFIFLAPYFLGERTLRPTFNVEQSFENQFKAFIFGHIDFIERSFVESQAQRKIDDPYLTGFRWPYLVEAEETLFSDPSASAFTLTQLFLHHDDPKVRRFLQRLLDRMDQEFKKVLARGGNMPKHTAYSKSLAKRLIGHIPGDILAIKQYRDKLRSRGARLAELKRTSALQDISGSRLALSPTEIEFDRTLDIAYALRQLAERNLFPRQVLDRFVGQAEVSRLIFQLSDIGLTQTKLTLNEYHELRDFLMMINAMLGTSFDVILVADWRGLLVNRQNLRSQFDSASKNYHGRYSHLERNMVWLKFGLDFVLLNDLVLRRGFFFDRLMAPRPPDDDKLVKYRQMVQSVAKGDFPKRLTPNPIKHLAFPSVRSSAILERSIRSHLNSMKNFGHEFPTLWVFDDLGGEAAREKQDMLRRLASEFAADIRYVGSEQKKEVIQNLAGDVTIASSGWDADRIRNTYFPGGIYGSNRNYLQAYFYNEIYSTVDDDSTSEVTLPANPATSEIIKITELVFAKVGLELGTVSRRLDLKSVIESVRQAQSAKSLLQPEPIGSVLENESDPTDSEPSLTFYGLLTSLYQLKPSAAEEVVKIAYDVISNLEMDKGETTFGTEERFRTSIWTEFESGRRVTLPVDAFGVHGRAIGRPASEIKALHVTDQLSFVERQMPEGAVGLVSSHPNLNGAGSLSNDIDRFLATKDVANLKGATEDGWNMTFIPTVSRDFRLPTPTMTTVNNRRYDQSETPGGLIFPGWIDSIPLGLTVQRANPQTRLYETTIALDHHREHSEVRYGAMGQSIDYRSIAKKFIEESLLVNSMRAYYGKITYDQGLLDVIHEVFIVIEKLRAISKPDNGENPALSISKRLKKDDLEAKVASQELIKAFFDELGFTIPTLEGFIKGELEREAKAARFERKAREKAKKDRKHGNKSKTPPKFESLLIRIRKGDMLQTAANTLAVAKGQLRDASKREKIEGRFKLFFQKVEASQHQSPVILGAAPSLKNAHRLPYIEMHKPMGIRMGPVGRSKIADADLVQEIAPGARLAQDESVTKPTLPSELVPLEPLLDLTLRQTAVLNPQIEPFANERNVFVKVTVENPRKKAEEDEADALIFTIIKINWPAITGENKIEYGFWVEERSDFIDGTGSVGQPVLRINEESPEVLISKGDSLFQAIRV